MDDQELTLALRQAEERGRQAGLAEAITWCRTQVYDEEAAKHDEYRRGQRRGAQDCVSVLERLVAYVPPREGVHEQWSGWSAIKYLGILSEDAGGTWPQAVDLEDRCPGEHTLHLLQVGLEKGRWSWDVHGKGEQIARGDCQTLLQAQQACLQEGLRLRAGKEG